MLVYRRVVPEWSFFKCPHGLSEDPGEHSIIPCQGWPQGPPSEVFLEPAQPATRMAFADGWLMLATPKHEGFLGQIFLQKTSTCNYLVSEMKISQDIGNMYISYDCQKRIDLLLRLTYFVLTMLTTYEWPDLDVAGVFLDEESSCCSLKASSGVCHNPLKQP